MPHPSVTELTHSGSIEYSCGPEGNTRATEENNGGITRRRQASETRTFDPRDSTKYRSTQHDHSRFALVGRVKKVAPLDAELPSEAEIERVRGETTDEKSLEQQLDRYRDDIEEWVKNKHSYVVIHALIRDQVPCSESTVRRYVKRAFPEVADAVMRRPTVVGEVMEVDFGYLGITYDAHSGRNRRTYVFSARFRHSRRAWRECVFDQTQQTFFCCHIHAFI